MKTLPEYEEEHWVIFNANYGIVDTVTLGRIEADDVSVWLDAPYDMVGPFSLHDLEEKGSNVFAECIVMTRQFWQQEQLTLRQESLRKRAQAHKRFYEETNRFNISKTRRSQHSAEHSRTVLELPLKVPLTVSKIKKAFRRLAKKTHPDSGGSHEAFLELAQARDDLLLYCQD